MTDPENSCVSYELLLCGWLKALKLSRIFKNSSFAISDGFTSGWNCFAFLKMKTYKFKKGISRLRGFGFIWDFVMCVRSIKTIWIAERQPRIPNYCAYFLVYSLIKQQTKIDIYYCDVDLFCYDFRGYYEEIFYKEISNILLFINELKLERVSIDLWTPKLDIITNQQVVK